MSELRAFVNSWPLEKEATLDPAATGRPEATISRPRGSLQNRMLQLGILYCMWHTIDLSSDLCVFITLRSLMFACGLAASGQSESSLPRLPPRLSQNHGRPLSPRVLYRHEPKSTRGFQIICRDPEGCLVCLYATVKLHQAVLATLLMKLRLQRLGTDGLSLRENCQCNWQREDGRSQYKALS